MINEKVLGVVSDTHISGKDKKLPSIFYEIFYGVDMVLHAGDLTSVHVIDLLEEIAPVEAVCGNMDSLEVKQRLPKKKLLEIEGHSIGLIHGWGPPWGIRDRIRNEFKKVDAIIYGHSHRQHAASEKGIYFFNPGAAMERHMGKRPTCGKLFIGNAIRGEIVVL